jgi:hypothetical protein
LEGLGIENFVTFYDHLEYVTAIWYNFTAFWYSLGSFGTFSILVHLDQRQIWQPCSAAEKQLYIEMCFGINCSLPNGMELSPKINYGFVHGFINVEPTNKQGGVGSLRMWCL